MQTIKLTLTKREAAEVYYALTDKSLRIARGGYRFGEKGEQTELAKWKAELYSTARRLARRYKQAWGEEI